MAVALADADGRVSMLRRHRFIQDRWSWELPGGLVDEDEEDAEAAVRVLADEADYRAGSLDLLVRFQPVPGRVDSVHAVFVGRDGEQVGDSLGSGADAHIEWVRLDDIGGLIAAGDIWHAASLVGLLHLLAFGSSAR